MPKIIKPQGDHITHAGRTPELDGLRCFIVLLIVSKHYGLFFFLRAATFADLNINLYRFVMALNGVDFFFVLSGFLLGRTLLRELDSRYYYRNFFKRRVSRTFPLYFFLLALFLVALWLLGSSSFLDLGWPFDMPLSLIAYALFLQNVVMAWAESLGTQWLEITWSLAVQEQFYLLLPFMLRWFRHPGDLALMLVLLILLALGCRLLFAIEYPPDSLRYLDVLLLPRMDSLGVGVLAALFTTVPAWRVWLARSQHLYGYLAAILLAGFALLVISSAKTGTEIMYVIGHTYLSFFYVTLVLLAYSRTPSLLNRILRVRVFQHLGRISYGVFLFHQAIRILLHGLLFGAVLPASDPRGLAATLTALALTLVVAHMLWRFVEQPIIAWARKDRAADWTLRTAQPLPF